MYLCNVLYMLMKIRKHTCVFLRKTCIYICTLYNIYLIILIQIVKFYYIITIC